MSKLIVSEPWDFHSVNGSNAGLGRVLKTYDSGAILFRLDSSIQAGSLMGDILYLVPRFEESQWRLELSQGKLSVNGGLVNGGCESMDESECIKSSIFALIALLIFE